MNPSYNEREVLELLQDESTQKRGFELIVAQYSEQLYYRIALNECLTFLNKQRAVTTVSIDDEDASVLQKLESDPYFSGDRAQKSLQKALLTLPEKQRMVFNLKYYQEMKYEEMSDIFGTSVGALKASYHHAVKKIEKFLEGEV